MKNIIDTQRLSLREFVLEDAEAVLKFNAHPEVMQYTGDESISSLEQASHLISETWLADYKRYGYGRWALIHKTENKIIGFAGLKYLPELLKTDIGFRMLPQYWGRGFATEVSVAILNHGFEHYSLEQIIGIVQPENMGSAKVLQKIGMHWYQAAPYLEGDKVYDWYQINKNDFYKNKR